jgi:hypothetical protein
VILFAPARALGFLPKDYDGVQEPDTSVRRLSFGVRSSIMGEWASSLLGNRMVQLVLIFIILFALLTFVGFRFHVKLDGDGFDFGVNRTAGQVQVQERVR